MQTCVQLLNRQVWVLKNPDLGPIHAILVWWLASDLFSVKRYAVLGDDQCCYDSAFLSSSISGWSFRIWSWFRFGFDSAIIMQDSSFLCMLVQKFKSVISIVCVFAEKSWFRFSTIWVHLILTDSSLVLSVLNNNTCWWNNASKFKSSVEIWQNCATRMHPILVVLACFVHTEELWTLVKRYWNILSRRWRYDKNRDFDSVPFYPEIMIFLIMRGDNHKSTGDDSLVQWGHYRWSPVLRLLWWHLGPLDSNHCSFWYGWWVVNISVCCVTF